MKKYEIVYKLRDWIDIDNLHWDILSKNPNAIHILEKKLDKIDWESLCENINPNAIPLLEKNLDKLNKDCWDILSQNENAISLLEKNQDKINWKLLSKNPNAIPLLEKNPNKIHWKSLCLNPNPNRLFHLLKKNLDKLNNDSWSNLSENPSIFEIDYMKTKKIW